MKYNKQNLNHLDVKLDATLWRYFTWAWWDKISMGISEENPLKGTQIPGRENEMGFPVLVVSVWMKDMCD